MKKILIDSIFEIRFFIYGVTFGSLSNMLMTLIGITYIPVIIAIWLILALTLFKPLSKFDEKYTVKWYKGYLEKRS